MQTEEHNNGQRAPTEVSKTCQHHQRTTKTVLGCQEINGVNLRSAIRRQQQQQQQQHVIGGKPEGHEDEEEDITSYWVTLKK